MNTVTRWILALITAIGVGYVAAQDAPDAQQEACDVAAEVASMTGGQ